MRAVRGVLPLSFPGVLNASVKLLCMCQHGNGCRGYVGRNGQLVVGEDLGHMLIQPVHLMAHRVFHFFHLLIEQVRKILLLRGNPCGRAHRLLRPRATSGHGDVNKRDSQLSVGRGRYSD